MKKITLLLSALVMGLAVQAQTPISVTAGTLTYTQDFNSLDTSSATNSSALPAGWSIFEFGTSATTVNQQYKGSTGGTNTGDTYSFGLTNDRALGSLASGSITSHYGAKFTNNTGVAITGFTLTYKGEQWRFGGPVTPATTRTNTDSLRFLYSTTATGVSDTTSASYTESTALMLNSSNFSGAAAAALDGNAAGNFTNKTGIVSVTIPVGGSIVIKWIDKNIQGNDDGLSVDDVNIVFSTSGTPVPNNRPNVTAVSPTNGATNVPTSTSSLMITFDRTVTGNAAGNVYVRNQTDNTTQTIAGNTATVAGNVVTVPGVTLLSSKTYYVKFDSTAFDTAGFKSYGLYDSTSWKFTTAGGSVGTVTSLSETFNNSCPAGLPAGWQQVNVTGGATWVCNTTGPNYNLTINGGGSTSSQANEDWLITPQLAATNNMRLYFKTRYNFGGPNMEVLYSTNYSGTGSPSGATWNTLVNPYAAADSNKWVTKSATLVAGNMYIAFKYISNANTSVSEGRRWDVDSVFTNNAQGIASVGSRNNSIGVKVIGTATSSNISIAFDLENNDPLQVGIYDLAGREVYRTATNGKSGNNKLNLQPQSIQTGMYIIRVSNGREQGIARTFVQ